MGNTVELRLQLLKDIGEGLSTRETVKHLSEKFGITQSGAYYHFENKDKWIGQYSDLTQSKNLLFQLFHRFNYVYREASFQYLHSQNDNARIGYLRTMLDAACQLRDFLPKEKDGSTVTPEKAFYLLMWGENDDAETTQKIMDVMTNEEKQLVANAHKLWTSKKIEAFRKRG